VTPHERLVEHLAQGTLDAADSVHSARCPACAALLQHPLGALEAPGAQLALLEAAHREAARPVRPWWVLGAGLGLLNAALAAVAITVLQPWNWGVSTSPHWLFLGGALLLAALVTIGAVWAQAPARASLVGALALAALAPGAVLLSADGQVANRRFLDGASCLLTVLALSLLPLASGAWLLTETAYSVRRALSVGLVSGGVGLLVLQFHCADGASPHLLVFHLLPWAGLGLAAILLRRLLPTSSYAP